MSTRYGRIQVRHDSAERWVTHNPVLFEGEWGFETDTGQAKIGVGKTWLETDYFSGHQDELTEQFEEMLAAEKEDRQNADAAIENHIARVKEGCEQADQSLAEHNDETNQRLAGEIDDRITGDKNLQVQVARLADEFDKLLAGIDDIDGEQLEIILQSAARLEDLAALDEKLEKEKAYRIEADEKEKKARQDADAALTAYNLSQDQALEKKIEEEAKAREDADLALNELIANEAQAREEADEALKGEFEEDQLRQDKELERVEAGSKARDVLLELQLLALKGSDCQHSNARVVENAPPYVYNYDIAVVDDHTLRVVRDLTESLELNVGTILSMDAGDVQVDHDWTEPITAIGEVVSHGTGWTTQDLSFEGSLPDFVVNAEVYDRVHLYGCNPIESVYVNKEDFALDQQRQDEALTESQEEQDEQFSVDQQRQDKALKAEQDARAERDLLHDAQLATLEYKLDSIVGLTFRGTYTFKHDTDCDQAYAECMAATNGDVAAGQQCARDMLACENGKVVAGTFEAVDPDDRFDHLEAIVIHKNAIDGEELEWDEILKEGDYLEVDHKGDDGLDKQNYGLYRVKADPVEATNASGEAVFDIELEFLQGAGVLSVDEDFEIRGINASEGVNPEELGDFLLKSEAEATYALKTHTHDYLPLSGGELTGNLVSSALYKTTRDEGYAFQVRPNNGDTAAYIHTSGHAVFSDRVEVDGKKVSLEGHTHSGYASSNHTHSNYASSSHTHSGYASSSHTHSGYASSSHSHSNMAIMKSGTSTNPSLSKGEMYLNTNQNVLYIGT